MKELVKVLKKIFNKKNKLSYWKRYLAVERAEFEKQKKEYELEKIKFEEKM